MNKNEQNYRSHVFISTTTTSAEDSIPMTLGMNCVPRLSSISKFIGHIISTACNISNVGNMVCEVGNNVPDCEYDHGEGDCCLIEMVQSNCEDFCTCHQSSTLVPCEEIFMYSFCY